MKADPGETTTVAAKFPEVVRELGAAYDRWWDDVLPRMENEDAIPPATAPYEDLYRKQFGA